LYGSAVSKNAYPSLGDFRRWNKGVVWAGTIVVENLIAGEIDVRQAELNLAPTEAELLSNDVA